VFIGVSGPAVLDPSDLTTMANDPIVFALANRDPEVDPVAARDHGRDRHGSVGLPQPDQQRPRLPRHLRRRARRPRDRLHRGHEGGGGPGRWPTASRPISCVPPTWSPSPFNEKVAQIVAEAVRAQVEQEHV
jgi:hypothetical protein